MTFERWALQQGWYRSHDRQGSCWACASASDHEFAEVITSEAAETRYHEDRDAAAWRDAIALSERTFNGES